MAWIGSGNDPDQNFSNLPQPYKLVRNIIELEILDPCWLEIIRRNKEILLGSDGKPLFIPKDLALKKVVPPQSKLDCKIQVTSIEESSNFFFITDHFMLSVLESYTMKTLLSSPISIVNSFIPDAEVSSASSPWIGAVRSHSGTSSTIICVCSVVTMTVAKKPEDSIQPSKGKKKTGTKEKEEEVKIEKQMHLLLSIYHHDTSSLDRLDFKSVELNGEEDRSNIKIDVDFLGVKADSAVVSVTRESNECTLFVLGPSPDTGSVGVTRTLKLPWDTIFTSNRIRNVFPVRSSPGDENSLVAGKALSIFDLAVTYRDIPAWKILTVVSSDDSVHLASQYMWKLSSIVCSHWFDSEAGILLLGLADGSVGMWSVMSKTFILTACRHLAPVVSINLCDHQKDWSRFCLVTGAADGTLCMHWIHTDAADPNQGAQSTVSDGDLPPSMSHYNSKYSFRHDRKGCAVRNIRSVRGDLLFFVEYADGTEAVYTFDSDKIELNCQVKPSKGTGTDCEFATKGYVFTASMGDGLAESTADEPSPHKPFAQYLTENESKIDQFEDRKHHLTASTSETTVFVTVDKANSSPEGPPKLFFASFPKFMFRGGREPEMDMGSSLAPDALRRTSSTQPKIQVQSSSVNSPSKSSEVKAQNFRNASNLKSGMKSSVFKSESFLGANSVVPQDPTSLARAAMANSSKARKNRKDLLSARMNALASAF